MVAGSSGAGKRNCFWEVAHSYLAYVDCETGVVYADGGMLVYPMNDEEYAAGYVLGRFCGRRPTASWCVRRLRKRVSRSD